MKKGIVFGLIMATVIFGSDCRAENERVPAKRPPSKSSMNQAQTLNEAMSAVDDLKKSVQQMSQQKMADCMKAFGSETFCACLRDSSPVGVSFVDYVQIVTSPKEKLGYATLGEDQRQMIDRTLAVRDTCAGKVQKPSQAAPE